jgi:DNA-3-methyladenine glycosylase
MINEGASLRLGGAGGVTTQQMGAILPLDFYKRDTTKVAKELLGKILVHLTPDGKRVAGRIVETEAYLGIKDRACHSFGDRKSVRTQPLYLGGGHSYVFLIYGMHYCFNVVTQKQGVPEAVLIRALEPVEGIDIMRARRPKAKKDVELTSGPGRLCSALQIDRNCDSLLLDQGSLFIEEAPKLKPSMIEASPRIGVDYAGEAALWPLRFSEKGNVFVSKPPRSKFSPPRVSKR